jgi:hypothetical protein
VYTYDVSLVDELKGTSNVLVVDESFGELVEARLGFILGRRRAYWLAWLGLHGSRLTVHNATVSGFDVEVRRGCKRDRDEERGKDECSAHREGVRRVGARVDLVLRLSRMGLLFICCAAAIMQSSCPSSCHSQELGSSLFAPFQSIRLNTRVLVVVGSGR